MKRRAFLAFSGMIFFAQEARSQANSHISTTDPLVFSFTKGRDVIPGKVKIELPKIAENGHSVSMTVRVDSPMSAAEHVKAVHMIAEKNPVREMAVFFFGPHSPRAEVSARIRLNGTQRVVAVAEMSNGTFWSDAVSIEVREAACTDGG
jgi:sulfur-oxidizing protein SoxY